MEANNLAGGVLVIAGIAFAFTLWVSGSVGASFIVAFIVSGILTYILVSDYHTRKKATASLLDHYKEMDEIRSAERSRKASLILAEYKRAIKENDRDKALELGRKYYSTLREDGSLTLYDEQAIANDLSVMK